MQDLTLTTCHTRVDQMDQILHCDLLPEWARWYYLACSGETTGSPKNNFPPKHTINLLLTKLVGSRRLVIGLAIFG